MHCPPKMESRSGVTGPIVHTFSPQLALSPNPMQPQTEMKRARNGPRKIEIEISKPVAQIVFYGKSQGNFYGNWKAAMYLSRALIPSLSKLVIQRSVVPSN